jgi:hypothetical protein
VQLVVFWMCTIVGVTDVVKLLWGVDWSKTLFTDSSCLHGDHHVVV